MKFVRESKIKFAGSQANLKLENADFAILGIPTTNVFKGGTELGPDEIREASTWFSTYSSLGGINYKSKLNIMDLGNLELENLPAPEIRKLISDAVGKIFSANVKPILLGGDHSITFLILESYPKKFDVFYFDAHPDVKDKDFEGKDFTHITTLRRISELKNCGKIWVLGMRAPEKEEIEFLKSHDKFNLVTGDKAEQLDKFVKTVEASSKSYYVSIDIDVLDPAFAPATENPVPAGISTAKLAEAVKPLATRKLIGMDLVEVAPSLNSSGLTQKAAAWVIKAVLEEFAIKQGYKLRFKSK